MCSSDLTEEDEEIIELIKERQSIVLLNKTDLPNVYNSESLAKILGNEKIINTAISKGEGIDELEKTIIDMFYRGDVEVKDEVMVTKLRHKDQLLKANKNIVDAINGMELNVPLDCLEVDVKNCWTNLGEISGDTVSEDIIDKVFSEFCIGK